MALASGLAVPAAFQAAALSLSVRVHCCPRCCASQAAVCILAPSMMLRHDVLPLQFAMEPALPVVSSVSPRAAPWHQRAALYHWAASGPQCRFCAVSQAASVSVTAPLAAPAPGQHGTTVHHTSKQPPSPQRRRVQGCSPHEAAAAAAAARAAGAGHDSGPAADGGSQADDAVMAQLMDMGFSAQKACKVTAV